MNDFRKSFLLVAVPIIALSILSTLGDVNYSWNSVLWFPAAGIAFVALIVAGVFSVKQRLQVAGGILAALAVGALSLALTCFSNVNELSW